MKSLQDFLRGCVISPKIEEELLVFAKEAREAATAAKKTAQTAETVVQEIGPDTRTALTAAAVGVMMAGFMAGVLYVQNTKKKGGV